MELISDNYFILHITLSVGLERKEETEDRRKLKNSRLKIKKTWTANTLLFIFVSKIFRTNVPRLYAFNLENLKPNST